MFCLMRLELELGIRAKGMLMAIYDISDDAAFEVMRWRSQEMNVKLYDIATEELSHLEVIGTIVAMLNKGAKGRLAEAAVPVDAAVVRPQRRDGFCDAFDERA